MPDGALQRAVELLGRLGEDSAEHTVAELATETGMPTSTAYRLLAELEQHGLVQRGADRTVALGTRLVALGRTAEAGLLERLVEPARELMSELSAEVGETVILTAACGLEAIVLHAVETDRHSVRLSYARFRRAPMHRGASGKILAAYLEPAERERLLEAADSPGLAEQLERIRADGFAFTAGELDEGAAAVAAPILDRRGRIAAGLSVAGPEHRIGADPQRLRAAVGVAAQRIERAQQR
jgi:DNA-binding IclR family transcriptional regulator